MTEAELLYSDLDGRKRARAGEKVKLRRESGLDRLADFQDQRESTPAAAAISAVLRVAECRVLTAGRMNPCANDFVPGRRTRPSPINTSLAAATLLPSGATQSAPAVGPGLQFGHSRDVANNPTTLTTRSRQEMNNGSLSAPSQYFSQPSATNTNTDDNMSEASAISAHYLEMRPELAGQKPEVFVQTSHPRGFKRFTMANNIEMKEAYEGAYGIVTNINPDYYIMPYGTRVINIKTDFPPNVHYSVRHSVWSTLEKVSQRIMGVWDARQHVNEKVLFLFAINGMKQFCGLAEMSGPWDPEAHIDGWEDNSAGAGSTGTIPLTWLYVKNVPYTRFTGVTQERNSQPVVNMWNGMHLDTEAGRRVIKIYVEASHFSNLLAWPRQEDEDGTANGAGLDRQHRNKQTAAYDHGNNHSMHSMRTIRGGRGQIARGGNSYGRGNKAMALSRDNWRQPQNEQLNAGQVLGEVEDTSLTPITARHIGMTTNANAPPPHFDGTAETKVGPRPGDTITYVANQDGDFVPMSGSMHLAHTNSLTHMPSREHFTNNPGDMRSIADLRSQGGQRGGIRADARGGHGSRWATRGDTSNARSLNTRDQLSQRSATNTTSGSDRQHSVPQVPSVATIKTQQATTPTGSGGPVLQLSSSSASFAPKNEQAHPTQHASSTVRLAPRPQQLQALQQAASEANFVPQAQQANSLQHTASTASFASQVPYGAQHGVQRDNDHGYHSGLPPPASLGLSSNYEVVADSHGLQHYNKPPSTAGLSDGSYPSWFRSTDSLAGYNPRYRPIPQRKVDDTPTHAPSTKQAFMSQQVAGWAEKTPTQANFAYPTPVDRSQVLPLNKQASYYRLMANRKMVDIKLSGLGTYSSLSEEDEVKYYELMANKAELEDQLARLTTSGSSSRVTSDGSPSRARTRDTSEADSINHLTSSLEKQNISPVRAKDGRVLDSVSKQGGRKERIARKGHRARNSPFTESFDARLNRTIDGMIESPPTSLHLANHTSPPAKVATAGTTTSPKTNPYSESPSDGDDNGGIRLVD